jgi:uncharacterized YigZ family protein
MTSADTYKTIRLASSGVYKDKGSKFISAAFPVSEEPQIKEIIEEVRKEHYEARHHCYAYMFGKDMQTWRANDDGEPSGTAGRPILGQIRSFGLTNVLIVVSRYFGGTLLGVSGLINAYKSAAESALLNDVMKILKEENVIQADHTFDLECRIRIQFRLSSSEKILSRLSRIEGLKYTFQFVK